MRKTKLEKESFLTCFFITWRRIRRFWSRRFRRSGTAKSTTLERHILRFLRHRSGFGGRFSTVKTRRIGGSCIAKMLLRDKGRAGVLGVVLGQDMGQINLVGVATAAAFFPDQVSLRQRLERRRHPLLADAKLLRKLLPGEDHKDLPLFVGPAVPAGELKAVQQKGIRHLGVQTHVRVAWVRKQPARHLHVVNALDIRLPHQGEIGTFFHLCGPHGRTSCQNKSLVNLIK